MKLWGENCFLPREEGEQLPDLVPGEWEHCSLLKKGVQVAGRELLPSLGGR